MTEEPTLNQLTTTTLAKKLLRKVTKATIAIVIVAVFSHHSRYCRFSFLGRHTVSIVRDIFIISWL